MGPELCPLSGVMYITTYGMPVFLSHLSNVAPQRGQTHIG